MIGNSYLTELVILAASLSGMIYTIRGVQVMLDSDLATLYGVDTRQLNLVVTDNNKLYVLVPVWLQMEQAKELYAA
nr:ORF6N domain-containing protein [Chlorobium sp. KB01]